MKSRLDELTAQHESMKSTFRSQSALSESLQEQLKRARDDARIATTAHEETALHYAQEKERHLGTQQQLAAAHFEVQQLQQKLEWCARARARRYHRPAGGGRPRADPRLAPTPPGSRPCARARHAQGEPTPCGGAGRA